MYLLNVLTQRVTGHTVRYVTVTGHTITYIPLYCTVSPVLTVCSSVTNHPGPLAPVGVSFHQFWSARRCFLACNDHASITRHGTLIRESGARCTFAAFGHSYTTRAQESSQRNNNTEETSLYGSPEEWYTASFRRIILHILSA